MEFTAFEGEPMPERALVPFAYVPNIATLQCPVFKKGKTDLMSNYRPISLLIILDKLLE